MAKLICLDSVSRWENDQITKYPEIRIFTDKLKKIVSEKPESGFYDPLLSETGKEIPTRKLTVNINLFSHQYAIGYNFITAHYLHNDTDIVIVKMSYL